MTEEILDKAYEIQRNIKKYKSFLKALGSPFVNIIRANDFEGDREKSQIITLASEPELEKMITVYFADKIEDLEQEFENIK